MINRSILIVEDNAICRGHVKRLLETHFSILECETKNEALQILKDEVLDMILLDISLPDSTGLDFLELLHSTYTDIPVIIFTEDEDPDTAADVIKKGAVEYLRKSKLYENRDLFLKIILKILESNKFKKMARLKIEEMAYYDRNTYVPDLLSYTHTYDQAELALKGKFSLLINGETGVGKNVMVKHLHNKLFSEIPLITIDCGVLCDDIIETELFGYEKGAFTDAKQRKIGKLEAANGGILFLDEISNASKQLQSKLLHVLQEKQLCRLGSTKNILIDFQLISASNRDLMKEIREGNFRQDLYYRIKQMEVTLPSLRSDIQILESYMQYFVSIYNAKYATNFAISSLLKKQLTQQKWLGNVRELDSEIQKIVFSHSKGQPIIINNENLKLDQGDFDHSIDIKKEYMEKQKRITFDRLEKNNFNVSATARELGVPRTTLQDRIKKYRIQDV